MSVYLTARAVADRLGVSERTVTNWCRTGRIPADTGCWQPAGYRGSWLIARAWLDAAPHADIAENAENAVPSAKTHDVEG